MSTSDNCAGKALLDARLQLIDGREELLRTTAKEWEEKFKNDLCCIKTPMIKTSGSLWWKKREVVHVPLDIKSEYVRYVGESEKKNIISITILGDHSHFGDFCWFSDFQKYIHIRLNKNGIIEGRFKNNGEPVSTCYDGCLEAVLEMVAQHIRIFNQQYKELV